MDCWIQWPLLRERHFGGHLSSTGAGGGPSWRTQGKVGSSDAEMMTLWRFIKHGDLLEQLSKIGNLLQSELENHLCFMGKSTIPEVIFYLPDGNGWIGIFERIFIVILVILSMKYGQLNAKHP